MTEKYTLPFALTSEAVRDWLGQQAELDTPAMANRFYSLAKALEQQSRKIDHFDQVLVWLLPPIRLLLTRLEGLIMQAQTDPTRQPKIRKWQRLGLDLLARLSAANEQWLKQRSVEPLGVLQGLHLLSWSLEFCYLSAAPTPAGYAARFGHLQALAQLNRDQPLPANLPAALKKFARLDQGVRYCWALFLCPLYFVPGALKSNYLAWLADQAPNLTFAQEPEATRFYWRPEIQLRPSQTEQAGALLINTEPLVTQLTQNPQELAEDPAARWRLVQLLSGYQSVFDLIFPNRPESCVLSHGFAEVFEQVRADNRMTAIQRLSGLGARQARRMPLDLEPLEHENRTIKRAHEPVGPSHAINARGLTIHLQTSGDQRFGLIHVRPGLIATGQPILIQAPERPPRLGIIRAGRIHNKTEIGKQSLLLEFVGESYAALDILHKDRARPSLLLSLPDRPQVLMVANDPALGYGQPVWENGVAGRRWLLGGLLEQHREYGLFELLDDVGS